MPASPGTARAALERRPFRNLYAAGFFSNIGSWMQTVVLGPFAYKLSGDSARFAGLVIFAQLGPQLIVAIPGGALSNRVKSRKALMQTLQVIQVLAAVFLAWVAAQPLPSKTLVLIGVAIGGCCNSLYAPNYQAIMPDLAGPENLAGAIALNSTQINASRVIGPVVYGILVRTVALTVSGAFLINAASFLVLIVVLQRMAIPSAPPPTAETPTGVRILTEGINAVRQSPILLRALMTMALMSFFSLVYIGQFQTIAERAFHVNSKSNTYSLIYATWGVGSLLSALSMGTVFAKVDKRRLTKPMLLGFSFFLTLFAFVRSSTLAFPVGFGLGCFYFGTPTALLTIAQQHLTARTRAPVMALWFMSFGGFVPLASLWGGWVMDGIGGSRGVIVVLLIGSVVTFFLAFYSDLRRVPVPLAVPDVRSN
jgi:MFS family permease